MSERKGTRALELWCKRLVKDCPNVQIENMTTSWRNGIAFCALVHYFKPELIDMSKLDPENVYENNQLAFSIAEKHLGIPALLDPEDMVENEVPDRLSILTYLSQFYQRLGHTVNTKAADNEANLSSPSAAQSTAPFKFGKAGLDKCAACGLPVYLAQRLIVAHKLYHRRCFRCSKCSGHLNPNNFEVPEGSDFFCDSCKSEKQVPKFLNNNDQMGMLAFSDTDNTEIAADIPDSKPDSINQRPKPQSILAKISMFEANSDKDSIDSKLSNLTLKGTLNSKHKDINTSNIASSTSGAQTELAISNTELESESHSITKTNESKLEETSSEKSYKSNINKFNFLQTQLSDEILDTQNDTDDNNDVVTKDDKEECFNENESKEESEKEVNDVKTIDENNITDDIRTAKRNSLSSSKDDLPLENTEMTKLEEPKPICVPPRRKKLQTPEKDIPKVAKENKYEEEYPEDLNPFADEEDEKDNNSHMALAAPKKVSTNPFGSSDEEDDDVPPIQPPPKPPGVQLTTPTRRLITAYNPFWSDGEEPSSDEESHNTSLQPCLVTSTPSQPTMTRRRKKGRAPQPPSVLLDQPSTSMDDVASISSYSSYNSNILADQKSLGKLTPKAKKRLAPSPMDSMSTASGGGSLEHGVDTAGRNISDQSVGRRVKGPAPGLPLPSRRSIRLELPPEQLQTQLDLLETQQLGLERQGVLLEQMIRDKCEGDEAEASMVPQAEVEDLVIQLCELVNEKNDLFRKQTELMYIRRQQRLEQEQADIEHEIRVIQSRPAVNRIDSDKAREDQLVGRLVEIVRLRDELVQQIDHERRRERQEDIAIAASIAAKRAQRNSESYSTSLKSMEGVTPKKNKVKDKVKKQLKKAKHTLMAKKKEDGGDSKDEKCEKRTK